METLHEFACHPRKRYVVFFGVYPSRYWSGFADRLPFKRQYTGQLPFNIIQKYNTLENNLVGGYNKNTSQLPTVTLINACSECLFVRLCVYFVHN